MIEFDLECPKNYPVRCNLTDIEKEALIRAEKYKGFLMYQFRGQQEYVITTLKKYFKQPSYYLFDAQEQAGLGVKICKICRLALASDFGLASLTPLNNYVFFEIGFMQGLGKPVVYLLNKEFDYNGKRGTEAIPFDLSDQMVIEHSDESELIQKLEREIPLFIEKVQLSTFYGRKRIQFIQNKLDTLNENQKKVLEFLVLEQATDISQNLIKDMFLHTGYVEPSPSIFTILKDLERVGFVKTWKTPHVSGEGRTTMYTFHEGYRDILSELLFKE